MYVRMSTNLYTQTIQIPHRRLGARNVLLQTDPVTKQVRAKLAGFGPLKGEEGADENKKVGCHTW